MQYLYTVILGLFVAAATLYLRLKPFAYSKSLGVDNWYWLLYIETYKKEKKFPVKLPYFLLEIEEQWYPPLYPLVLSKFSLRLLNKYAYLVSPVTDCLQAMLLYILVYLATKSIIIAGLAGLIYAFTPLLLSVNTQLNPRGLGSLLLTTVILLLFGYSISGNLYYLVAAASIGTVILLLHKMTTQMMWFYFLAFSMIERNIAYLALIPATIMLAVIVSKGFYIKVLRAHWDIVSFWNRNIKYLGAHQYYDSPLYQKEGYQSDTLLHRPGIKGVLAHVQRIFAYNPFILAVGIGYILSYSRLGAMDVFFYKWISITYLWILMTGFVPFFKALGAGYLYIYNSAFAVAYIAAKFSHPALLLACFALAAYVIKLLYKKTKDVGPDRGVDEDLKEILSYLKDLPKDNVFCIPFQLPDATAYFSRKRVVWGAHGYGFKTLEPLFPVMKMKVEDVLSNYDANYILYYTEYLDSISDILDEPDRLVKLKEKGDYILYEISR